MLLEAIRVFAIPPIIGTDGGFDVGNVSRLRAEYAQEGGWVHCSRADLSVVGLADEASVGCPVFLELEEYFLEA